MGQLYERAEIYDLIESEQRTASIRKDWEMFLGERPIKTFLDVSIGTGGMTLPLQELGMELFGSDLSEAMLARCREKALAKQKPFELQCSDFRDLSCWGDRQFDCVASTGNALGYVPHEDVLKTLEEMDAHVKPGGYLCFDSRNWEKIQKESSAFICIILSFTGKPGSIWFRCGITIRTAPWSSICFIPLNRTIG